MFRAPWLFFIIIISPLPQTPWLLIIFQLIIIIPGSQSLTSVICLFYRWFVLEASQRRDFLRAKYSMGPFF